MASRRVLTITAVVLLGLAGLWFVSRRALEPQAVPRAQLRPAAGRADRPALLATQPHTGAAPAAPRATLPASQVAFPAPRFKPRAAGEWQGMLVDLNEQFPCEAPDGCGLARACKRGQCLACELDSDCTSGEACVLDHCIPRELVGCRRSADCGSSSTAFCKLSPYTASPRGNETMASSCGDQLSGTKTKPASSEPVPVDPRSGFPADDLLRRAREAAQAK